MPLKLLFLHSGHFVDDNAMPEPTDAAEREQIATELEQAIQEYSKVEAEFHVLLTAEPPY